MKRKTLALLLLSACSFLIVHYVHAADTTLPVSRTPTPPLGTKTPSPRDEYVDNFADRPPTLLPPESAPVSPDARDHELTICRALEQIRIADPDAWTAINDLFSLWADDDFSLAKRVIRLQMCPVDYESKEAVHSLSITSVLGVIETDKTLPSIDELQVQVTAEMSLASFDNF